MVSPSEPKRTSTLVLVMAYYIPTSISCVINVVKCRKHDVNCIFCAQTSLVSMQTSAAHGGGSIALWERLLNLLEKMLLPGDVPLHQDKGAFEEKALTVRRKWC